jgi:uncharacterized protein (DUF488 family)
MSIYTIGYEGLTMDAFLMLLKFSDVDTVLDIRELPLSRKPGFSKNSLRNTLAMQGMDYQHIPALGCPKPIRDQYRTDQNWSCYKVGFLAHLAAQADTVSALAATAKSSTYALLCYEADYNYCHRSMVAAAIHHHGKMSVIHLQASMLKTRAAELHQLELA